MKFHVIIPARYAATRLPGKPLLDIGGRPMIRHVYERASASGAASVTVATDDVRIADAVRGFGGAACMTAARHRSGTDRLAEAVALLGLDARAIVVNLQGDEPRMPPALIRQVAALLHERGTAMATACHPLHDRATLADPDTVKVVRDVNGDALYFSRAPIPWPRDAMRGEADAPVRAFRHIGLYAYRAEFIGRFAAWSPCALEEIEMLEQLRALWHGEKIAVCEAEEAPGPGVDTPADLERVRVLFADERGSG